MSKKLKYAVVGCSNFGKAHLNGLVAMPDVEIVALCDVHMDICEERKQEYKLNANCYNDHREMLKNEEIDIVLLEGTPGSTAAIGRTEGILAGLENHPNWTIVDRGSANFTQGEGQTYMENLLRSGTISDIDVIISENDNMIFGAMKALERNDLTYGPDGEIIMISFDALYEAFEKMMAGQLHASIECNPLLAGTVEQVILDLEAGKKVEKVYNIEEGVYTYKNAAEFIDERKY